MQVICFFFHHWHTTIPIKNVQTSALIACDHFVVLFLNLQKKSRLCLCVLQNFNDSFYNTKFGLCID